MKQVDQIKNAIENSENIVITTHRSPDGDAIGSSQGLKLLLNAFGKSNVSVIVPDGFPKFLDWMNPSNEITYYDKEQEKSERLLKQADLIFSLDYNALSRIGEMGGFIENLTSTKIVVDHHQNPDDFADFYFIDTNCCSTAQLVYELAEALNSTHLFNELSASCLYCGIMTDTGSFRFPSTTDKTHEIIASLIKLGANGAQIHQNIYDTNSVERLRLLGYALTEKMKVFPDKNAAFIFLSQEDLKRYNYQSGDTEGLVNYPLTISGIKFSALIKEHNNMVKMSFRSKNDVFVNEFANKHFNGGGHVYAAGGRSDLNFEDTILRLEELILAF